MSRLPPLRRETRPGVGRRDTRAGRSRARASRGRGSPTRLGLTVLAVLLFLAPAHDATAQQVITCPAPAGIAGELTHPMAAVRYLADDRLEGRLAGSVGERCAAEYIALEFSRLGLAPGGQGGGFLQAVELRSAVNPHAPEGQGVNVIGVLEGSDPRLRAEAVVVGAHHDHLGRGEVFGSLAGPDDPPGGIHNGADDNASGVGALLAVAQALAEGPRPARSVVFVTFTGEESGLLGSQHYVQNAVIPMDLTVAMINMDMVGRLEADPLIVNGTGTAEEWNAILDEVEVSHGVPLARSPEGFGPSDHTSFYARDVPVLHFFTNVHAEYHRPTDEWERIDREGLERVAALVEAVVREAAGRPEPLAHIAGAGAPQTFAGGERAYLGTVPDFAPADFGVRLSGVTEGSPAAAAGLQAGDILIGLGPFEIEDLYVMTEALEVLEAGTEVEAVVLRDGERLSFSVVLGSR